MGDEGQRSSNWPASYCALRAALQQCILKYGIQCGGQWTPLGNTLVNGEEVRLLPVNHYKTLPDLVQFLR